VINSIQPAAFIAKAEIEKWPVVGLLVARSGTLFIERGKRHAVHQVLQDAVDRLKQQRFVAVFPEGTTNDGRGLLPFHGNMMEAAIRAGVPVQPIAIAYRNSNGALAESVAFVGQTTFVGSMLRVLADNELHVEISVLPLQQSVGSNRHELAKLSRIAVSKALQFVDEPNDQ
jgi:1-acyl-sn-glycerol-3-phosphate acyltransferase